MIFRRKYFKISIFLGSSLVLLDRPSFVHPSIILWQILKIKRNKFLDVLAVSHIARKNYFSELCITEQF